VANTNAPATTLDLGTNTLTLGGTGLSFTNGATTIGTNGSIVKNGTGLLYLNSALNTYSGGFTLNNGEVQFTSSGSAANGVVTNSAFGTGTLTLNGGTIGTSSSVGTSGRTVNNAMVLNGTIQFGMNSYTNSTNALNTGSALFTAGTNGGKSTTLTADSTMNTFCYVQWEQPISGNYRLTKGGVGSVTLSNNYLSLRNSNNIQGVTLNSGMLGYKNINALGTGTLILAADGVEVGQDGAITGEGDTIEVRKLPNNISI
jgi:autotransporter-associated beta strand protein